MRFPWHIFLFLLFPAAALAQYGTITGKVINADSKSPLARASVFLSNSSVGTASQENGSFILSGIRPGQYTLVVSLLGYEQYEKTILVGPETINLTIQIAQKPLMLREVVIQSSADWKKNFEAFKKEFIGSNENAKYCTILNPKVLNITYNPTKQILHADADEFLIVENKALGYRVKFLLNDFAQDKIAEIVSQKGQRIFEELPGSEAQKKKWHEKREEAYHGSSMHFFRSLYTDKLTQDGFQIYQFTRTLNPQRPTDEEIRRKVRIFYDMQRPDSQKYYIDWSKVSKYSNERLMQPPLNSWEVLISTGQPGVYGVHFRNYLYVVYTKKTDDTYDRDLYRPMNMSNYAVSIITLGGPYALFDKNGIIVDGSPLFEGAWSRNRLSDMLPVDYVPDDVAH